MSRVSKSSWRARLIVLLAALVLLADQVTKVWIRTHLAVGETLFEWGIFSITRVPPNTGAAFGLFRSGTVILIFVSTIFAIMVLLYAFTLYRRFPFLDTRRNNLAFGLILGGTLGNLAERVNASLGGVTDFIAVGWWPAFNVADSAVTVGAVLLGISLLFSLRSS
ncbi:MAG: signal peptidase II [Dehalococcoidia bacterium]|nr:MAG: signal peptidase II [Dehalococcoidia bacterium]